MTDSTIRIGLLGASRIARGAILEPASDTDGVEVTRVAARSVDKAQAYADEHGIPGIEKDYAALAASDAVDLVYNALPPSGHMEWSIAALEAGKHVLSEKPFAMNAGQAQRMVDVASASPGVLVEAFHHRFHPLHERILEIVASGRLGDIQRLESHFDVAIPYRPGELRHTLEVGGGALMDLGCYPLHWVRTVMKSEPAVVQAEAFQERLGVDTAMTATLDFDGVPASIGTTMAEGTEFRADLILEGSRGCLTVINPLSPHNGHELIIELDDGSAESTTVEGNSTYWHQLAHIVDVLNGRAEQITGGADAIANMRAIDAIYEAAGMRPRGT